MTNKCRTVFYCGAAFLLLLGCAFVLKPGAVWITDNGNKYIMMRNFAKGEGTVIKHVFPELFPTGGFHFIKVPGGAVSFYPEYLSFITVPFYKLFGERGTLFFPLLATLLRQFLKEHKSVRFTLLLSPRFRRMDDAVLKKLLTTFPLLSQPERLTGKGGFPDLFRGTCAVAPSN